MGQTYITMSRGGLSTPGWLHVGFEGAVLDKSFVLLLMAGVPYLLIVCLLDCLSISSLCLHALVA